MSLCSWINIEIEIDGLLFKASKILSAIISRLSWRISKIIVEALILVGMFLEGLTIIK